MTWGILWVGSIITAGFLNSAIVNWMTKRYGLSFHTQVYLIIVIGFLLGTIIHAVGV